MTTAGEFNPSTFTIESAVITGASGGSQDIANIIVGWEIMQSMDMVAYDGMLEIEDTIGVLGDFPLRSEETLDLSITCHDIGTNVELKAHVYKITDIVPIESNNGVLYRIHFVSLLTYEASKRRITKSYRDTPQEIARQVFDTYFSRLGNGISTDRDPRSRGARQLPFGTLRYPVTNENNRSFYIQTTGNRLKTCIPYFTPTETMRFLASRSYAGNDSPSQTFRFFETLENFYFVTDEFFIKEIEENRVLDFFYGPAASIDPAKPYDQINRIEDLRILNKGIDVATDIFSGSYRTTVTEIDFIRGKLNYLKFDYSTDARYIDMSGNPRNLSDNPHTPEFRRSTFTEENARQFLVFKDYSGAGDLPTILSPDSYGPSIIANRVSYYHHLNNTMIQASFKGRLDVRPGHIVNLDIKNLSSNSGAVLNDHLSGRYLVKSITHTVSNSDIVRAAMILVKFDWSGT
jgi:hypothetical protein